MRKDATVSIILTSYNQKQKLERAFLSIIEQNYKDIEIIIVDDASTDTISQAYIKSLANQYPSIVRYYFQPFNVGIAKNKNTGFKMARGRYITYLDGDDFYYPEKIAREVAAFLQDPSLDVVYSNFCIQDAAGCTAELWNVNGVPPEGFAFNEVISRSFPRNMLYRCEMVKAEVLEKIGYYDESVIAYHDWDARTRYSKFCKLKYIDNVGSAYVLNPAGISKTKSHLFLLQEQSRVFEKNKPLLSDLAPSVRQKIESAIKACILKGLVLHCATMRQFWESSIQYLILKPSDAVFVLRQVYARIRKLIFQ
ncbi:MAG: glycosyltransferase [Bacteroidetes bacterium]|nr:glycosyltransferase [Bacteroidota bacterium]